LLMNSSLPKGKNMIPNTTQTGTRSTYPGHYIPALFKPDELQVELQKPRNVETTPLVNITEDHEVFTIEVAAPGLRREDFLVSTDCIHLTISVFLNEDRRGNEMYRQQEFNYSCFQREIILPGNTDPDFIYAVYENGILRLIVPKTNGQTMQRVDRIIVY